MLYCMYIYDVALMMRNGHSRKLVSRMTSTLLQRGWKTLSEVCEGGREEGREDVYLYINMVLGRDGVQLALN